MELAPGVVVNFSHKCAEDCMYFVTHVDPLRRTFPVNSAAIYTSHYNAEIIRMIYEVEDSLIHSYDTNRWYKVENNKKNLKFALLESKFSSGSVSILFHSEEGTSLYTGPFILTSEFFNSEVLKPIMMNLTDQPLKNLHLIYNSEESDFDEKEMYPYDFICNKIVHHVRQHSTYDKIHLHSKENAYHVVCDILQMLEETCVISEEEFNIMKLLGKGKLFSTNKEASRLSLVTEMWDEHSLLACRGSDLCIHVMLALEKPPARGLGKNVFLYLFPLTMSMKDALHLQEIFVPETFSMSLTKPGNSCVNLNPNCISIIKNQQQLPPLSLNHKLTQDHKNFLKKLPEHIGHVKFKLARKTLAKKRGRSASLRLVSRFKNSFSQAQVRKLFPPPRHRKGESEKFKGFKKSELKKPAVTLNRFVELQKKVYNVAKRDLKKFIKPCSVVLNGLPLTYFPIIEEDVFPPITYLPVTPCEDMFGDQCVQLA